MFDPFTFRGFFQWVVAGFAFCAGWTVAENVLAMLGRAIAAALT